MAALLESPERKFGAGVVIEAVENVARSGKKRRKSQICKQPSKVIW